MRPWLAPHLSHSTCGGTGCPLVSPLASLPPFPPHAVGLHSGTNAGNPLEMLSLEYQPQAARPGCIYFASILWWRRKAASQMSKVCVMCVLCWVGGLHRWVTFWLSSMCGGGWILSAALLSTASLEVSECTILCEWVQTMFTTQGKGIAVLVLCCFAWL